MATVNCGRGHIYDSSQYKACPYCEKGGTVIDFNSAPSSGGYGGTVAPEYGMDQNGRTPGGTVAPDHLRKKDQPNKTVMAGGGNGGRYPTVGWLVCVKGAEKGKDYRLVAKNNKIGRDPASDVYIEKDPTISGKHAKLAYDERHNSFELIPSENTNILYLNDNPVYIPVTLSAYDCIEMGNSKFIFVPFCSEKFSWNGAEDKRESSVNFSSQIPRFCPKCGVKTEKDQVFCNQCGSKL